MGQGGQGAGQGRAAQPTLAQGPKGSRGTELTGRAGEARVAAALPAAAHAIHARAALVTGAAGAARASSGRGEERGEVRPRQEPRTCTPSPRALENTWTPNPVHQVPYHLHHPPAQNTLSCRSTHPSLTTPSPLLCSQPSWGLGGPGSRVCSLGTLTSALAAVVTRAAAGLPGGGDAAAVAAPAQALGVSPGAGPGPHAAQGQGVQRRGRPELGEVAPAGLRAALGQEGSGCKPAPVGPCPAPPPSAQPLTCSCEPGGQGGSSPQMLQTFCEERKATRQVEWVDRTVPSGLGTPLRVWPVASLTSHSGRVSKRSQRAPRPGGSSSWSMP